jgi:hypothetical protein
MRELSSWYTVTAQKYKKPPSTRNHRLVENISGNRRVVTRRDEGVQSIACTSCYLVGRAQRCRKFISARERPLHTDRIRPVGVRSWPATARRRHDGRPSTRAGRVEMWRGDRRFGLSVAAPFVWRCPSTPNRTCRSPASGCRTEHHAFAHDWLRPRAVRRTRLKYP